MIVMATKRRTTPVASAARRKLTDEETTTGEHMIVWDKETDNLLAKVTKIHCIVVIDRDTGKVERYRDAHNKSSNPADGDIRAGLARVAAADEIGGHNVHNYDIPVGQKLYPGEFYPKGKVRDSLVESEMWYPAKDLRNKDFLAQKKYGNWISNQYYGRHSLAAWGERLKRPKDDYAARCKEAGIDPWATWSEEMEEYCVQDVVTNVALFDFLEKTFDYSTGAADLENRVAPILVRQEQWGVKFNTENAGKLHAELIRKQEKIGLALRDYFPNFYMRVGKAVTPKKTLNYKDKLRPDLTEGVSYVKVKMTEFNPGSRQHIYKRLLAVYNWKPKTFSPSGEPEVSEETIGELTYDCAPLLNEYLLVDKRIGQIANGKVAWLRKEKDGIIYGRVKANGTRTSRCSHVNPNMGQVPKVKKDLDGNVMWGEEGGWGADCRALFGARKGRKQMGVDLSGIEMRAQGHYMARYDGGFFAQQVVEGDVHDLARIAMNFNSRDITKTFEYAMTYGSGFPNLGSIVYSDMTDEQKKAFGKPSVKKFGQLGKQRKEMLTSGLDGFDKLLAAVETAYGRGWMKALDGRRLAVPSKHSALNTLFQGFGGVLAKTWLVIFNDLLVDAGLIPDHTWYIDPHASDTVWKVVQMLFIHDELQTDCITEEVAHQAGKLAVQAAQATRDVLSLKVDIDAEYKVGDSWAECH